VQGRRILTAAGAGYNRGIASKAIPASAAKGRGSCRVSLASTRIMINENGILRDGTIYW